MFLHGTPMRQTVVSFLTAVLEAAADPVGGGVVGGKEAMPLWPCKN